MSKKKPNKQWVESQNKDQYVKRARDSHYRSRAVYKLQQIDEKDKLIQAGNRVVDLGSAPGGWSQYARERVGVNGKVIAVDILPMEPIADVHFIQGDFTETEIEKACLEQTNKDGVDLVISDMAPNLSGIRATDQARSMALAELAYDFCHNALKPGGHFLIKLFEGAGAQAYRQALKEHFAQVLTRKPDASRNNSREFYVLARSYKL